LNGAFASTDCTVTAKHRLYVNEQKFSITSRNGDKPLWVISAILKQCLDARFVLIS
jgi:hypothetical protein